jgi:hydroxymethylglutaryl-CoA reductase
LIEAVREWLERDVLTVMEGRAQFHARVAINVLSIVEREVALGAGQAEAQRERLQTLGVADESELAEAIRSGRLDDRLAEVRALVWESVRDKLAVANPKYLDAP